MATDTPYQPADPNEIVAELFSGRLPIQDAISRLRVRLLDLTSRNRLLNYRHPKNRSVQFVGMPSLDLIYDRIVENGKGLPVRWVPEPEPLTYSDTGKRPDATQHAKSLKIDISVEAPKPKEVSAATTNHGRRNIDLQALHYPAELERLLRKMNTEARSAIDETGSNILFLIFGFLEFYEKDESDKPMLAPIIAVPVALERKEIDLETRVYRYVLAYTGEDVAENHTLREKLSQDFSMIIPELEDEDTPETYFEKIQAAVEKRARWRIRRQLTLGMLSFGKLAIWADLDDKKWPGLIKHPLLKMIFEGDTNGHNGEFYGEDYKIDETQEANQPLIYAADSSQHSAIIDVLAGKNMVINGPPGTGKSQTITNIIATALSNGKKVLFVSEKLAALEVVQRRLNQAGLGEFCLELHSNKTQRKKFIEDLNDRISKDFTATPIDAQLARLSGHREKLARYAELMGSVLGNELGLTVNQVLWAAARRRQELNSSCESLAAADVSGVSRWTHDDLQKYCAALEESAKLFPAVGTFGREHPWWGFYPRPLIPGEDGTIAEILLEATELADIIIDCASRYQALGGEEDIDESNFAAIRKSLDALPDPPSDLLEDLLPIFFTGEDSNGSVAGVILDRTFKALGKAETLLDYASSDLMPDHELTVAAVQPLLDSLAKNCFASVLENDTEALRNIVNTLKAALSRAQDFGECNSLAYCAVTEGYCSGLENQLSTANDLGVTEMPLDDLGTATRAVFEAINMLMSDAQNVRTVMQRRNIVFDGTPFSAREIRTSGIRELKVGAKVEEKDLAVARRLCEFPLRGYSLEKLQNIREKLTVILDALKKSFGELRTICGRLRIEELEGTEEQLREIDALAQIAARAPQELLDYRRGFFQQTLADQLVDRLDEGLKREELWHGKLDSSVYLDALPGKSELKSHLSTLRQSAGFFSFLRRDYRQTKTVVQGISRIKKKYRAAEWAEILSDILLWMEHREQLVSDPEFKECIGPLFCGLGTDISKVRTLRNWYKDSHRILLEQPSLADKIDLTSYEANRIGQLAARADRISAAISSIFDAYDQTETAIETDILALEKAKRHTCADYIAALGDFCRDLGDIIEFFTPYIDQSLSPQRALDLMEGSIELTGLTPELTRLSGNDTIARAAGPALPFIATATPDSWFDYLPFAEEECRKVKRLVDYLDVFPKAATVATALRSIKAKLALDEVLKGVSSVWRTIDDWRSYYEHTRDVINGLHSLAESFSGNLQEGRSVKDGATALSHEKAAYDILDEIENDPEVLALFGNYYVGLSTDRACIRRNFDWGRHIATCGLSKKVLLNVLRDGPQYQLSSLSQIVTTALTAFDDLKATLSKFRQFGAFDLTQWHELFDGGTNRILPEDIKKRLEIAFDNLSAVFDWSKYLAARDACPKDSLRRFVEPLESGDIEADDMAMAVEFACYNTMAKNLYRKFPELTRFNGSSHEAMRQEYQRLDKEIISLRGRDLAFRIDGLKRPPLGQRGIHTKDFTEMELIRHEIGKTRRHIPIRQLLKRAGKAVQELKPCFMMGPLSVAQYLDPDSVRFDVVIMDEASQLKPEEAIGTVARGAQLVVVGDARQLPPTNFFDRMLESGEEEDEDEALAIQGMESILDICQQLFTVRSLRWHYRSQHDSLIAFSNFHFYKNLVVFPSPFRKSANLGVRYHYVRNGVYQNRQNIPEAQRVVDVVCEHMIKRPEESLGVVSLNQSQRDLIEELLDRRLRVFSEGQEFLQRHGEEGWPFFVKNLENVQGDERDVIMISTTFGKAPGTDRTRQNFGPISRDTGWRRLNVLFTRARKRIHLFTSMMSEDIVIDEKTPTGTKALRDYLEFARKGILVDSRFTEKEPENDFEVSVAALITGKGYRVTPQFGVAGFFIDMVVHNPDRPGELMAAIECDGATYHSSASVRDRDRIRQEILESLGWKNRIWRIWSTDWFTNPRKEAQRLFEFLEGCRSMPSPQAAPEYEPEPDEEKTEASVGLDKEIQEALSISEVADIFAEVGDRLTYCFKDKPDEKRSVWITDGESNTKMKIANEKTPVALALLGLAAGEENKLEIPGQKARTIRLLKIEKP